ncbi:baseplate assembly protein [Lysobacter sp. CA196]|uniref:baseplate assembly protein n=1 Tax=Lysobacter sp. CA196 TaxID=3455606 RepID=UPI003F8D0DB4
MSAAEPNFIQRDPAVITAELVADYERITGKTLYPAQIERIWVDLLAYRETLVRVGIQEAAKQNLVAFARAPILDYLGELVGVVRLPAQAARTVLRFTFAAPLTAPRLVPAGVRVESDGGDVTFATDTDVTAPVGAAFVDCGATCLQAGAAGNGWGAGKLNEWLDAPLSGVASVANLSASNGGVDEESDDRLRERIKLGPESFSNAGSRLAYRFHALKASQAIVDVAVLSPVPGEVKLYPLTETGLPDATLLSLVEAICSADKVRPLTDHVQARAPVPVDYTIAAALTLYAHTDAATVQAQARAAAERYAADRAAGLGRDIVPTQVIAALSVPGVYEVRLAEPAALRVLSENEWARCSGIALTLAGSVNG